MGIVLLFAFHAWAVTVTGAPKLWAMQFVEDNERSSRRWYAGAIGAVNFDGSINTGLTIRTIRMKDGLADINPDTCGDCGACVDVCPSQAISMD